MKKIILIVFFSLMFANNGFAEIKQIEQKTLNYYHLATACVDGFKFVVATQNAGGVSVVQFFEQAHDLLNNPRKHGNPQPAKC